MDRKLLVVMGLVVALVAAFAIWKFAAEEEPSDFDPAANEAMGAGEKDEPVVGPRRESGPVSEVVEDKEKTAPAWDRSALVRGRVVFGEGGPPAPGAAVRLRLLGRETLAEAIADAEGAFLIAAPAGEEDLVLAAACEGHVSREIVDLELETDEDRDLGTIVLRPAIEIRGTVHDARGVALAGARIQLVPNLAMTGISVESVKQMLDALEIDDEALAERTSDEKGEFLFAGVATGTYALIAAAEGCQTAYSRRLTLQPGQAREEVDFVLGPACTLRGRVTDAEGRGLGGAIVSVLPTGNDFPSLFRTLKSVTDASGAYELTTLPQGRLMVMCRKEGLAPFGDNLQVEPETKLDIRLTPGWRLHGIVLDATTNQPIEGVELAVISDDSLGLLRDLTDVEGKFDFPHVPDSKLEVIVVHKEGLQIVDDGRMRVMNGPFSFIDPRKDENGKYPDYLEIRMTGGGRIEGRVIDADSGVGISGARVYSLGGGDTELAMFAAGGGVVSDADGNFVLEGVPAGPYLLNASARGFYPAEPITRDRLRGRDGAPPMIAVGQSVVDVVVKLRRGLAQKGRVLDPEGEALWGARIDWVQMTDGQGSFEMMMLLGGGSLEPVISDDDGRFTIEGLQPDAALAIEALHPDYMGGGSGEVAADRLGAEELVIRVGHGGRVEGRLRLEGGGDPTGTLVTLRRENRRRSPFERRNTEELQAMSDSLGRFAFEDLAAGEYWYTVAGQDDFRAPQARQNLEVKGGGTTELVIDLFRNWKIEGQVIDESGKPVARCRLRVEAIDPEGIIAAEREQPGYQGQGRTRSWERTDQDGRFTVSELDGRFDYEIRVQGPRDRESREPAAEATVERVKVATRGLRITLERP